MDVSSHPSGGQEPMEAEGGSTTQKGNRGEGSRRKSGGRGGRQLDLMQMFSRG